MKRESIWRLRQVLNLVFCVLVVVAVAVYFALPLHKEIFYILGFTAVLIKMAEVCIRLSQPKDSIKKNRER